MGKVMEVPSDSTLRYHGAKKKLTEGVSAGNIQLFVKAYEDAKMKHIENLGREREKFMELVEVFRRNGKILEEGKCRRRLHVGCRSTARHSPSASPAPAPRARRGSRPGWRPAPPTFARAAAPRLERMCDRACGFCSVPTSAAYVAAAAASAAAAAAADGKELSPRPASSTAGPACDCVEGGQRICSKL